MALNRRSDCEALLWSWPPPPRRPADTVTALRELAHKLQGIDVLHVHQVDSWIFDLSILLKPVIRCPVVLSDLGGGWRNPGRAFGHLRYAFVDGLAAISDWSMRVDLSWPISKTHEVIYGGGSTDGWEWADTRSAGEGSFARSDYLFVGRIVPHKGVDVLASACPPRSKLRIVGRANDPEYLTRVLEIARQIHLDVDLRVDATDSVVKRAYESTDFLVLPTQKSVNGTEIRRPELLGLVLLEAFEHHVPTISSDAGALAEIQHASHMPTFRAGDVEDLRRLLRHLPSAGTPEYRDMQARASDAANRFSWASTADRCMKLYREITHDGGRRKRHRVVGPVFEGCVL